MVTIGVFRDIDKDIGIDKDICMLAHIPQYLNLIKYYYLDCLLIVIKK